jgi:hypothetical protein
MNTEYLTYRIDHYERHNYKFTQVTVTRMRDEKVADLLDGAINNKAGYGTMEVALRQEGRFRTLLERGIETVYDPSFLSRQAVSLEWQHYEADGFCEPFLNLGRNFCGIGKGMRLLRQIGARIEKVRAARRAQESKDGYTYPPTPVGDHTFASPHDFVAALARMRGSVQVTRDPMSETWIATPVKFCTARAA